MMKSRGVPQPTSFDDRRCSRCQESASEIAIEASRRPATQPSVSSPSRSAASGSTATGSVVSRNVCVSSVVKASCSRPISASSARARRLGIDSGGSSRVEMTRWVLFASPCHEVPHERLNVIVLNDMIVIQDDHQAIWKLGQLVGEPGSECGRRGQIREAEQGERGAEGIDMPELNRADDPAHEHPQIAISLVEREPGDAVPVGIPGAEERRLPSPARRRHQDQPSLEPTVEQCGQTQDG